MIDGKVCIEVRGIPVLFDTNAVNSFSAMRKMRHIVDGTNVWGSVDIIEDAFGEEQLDNIEKQLAADKGVCTAEDMTAFFFEAFEKVAHENAAEAKN